jgi:hypothetical protein
MNGESSRQNIDEDRGMQHHHLACVTTEIMLDFGNFGQLIDDKSEYCQHDALQEDNYPGIRWSHQHQSLGSEHHKLLSEYGD